MNHWTPRGAAILKIFSGDCLHDSHGCCVGISTYRNGPKYTKNNNFLHSNWEFIFENWEKRGYFGLGTGPRVSDPGEREKRPCKWMINPNHQE